jgi:RNA polymerase primary sigma factor
MNGIMEWDEVKGLAWSIINEMLKYPQWHRLDPDDLIQESYFGYLKCCDRWDAERGAKFSTYVHYWFRATIYRYAQANSGGLSGHRYYVAKGSPCYPKLLRSIYAKSLCTVFLPRNARRYSNALIDPLAERDAEQVDTKIDGEFVKLVMKSCLSPREREWVMLYVVDGLTLQQIGEKYNYTRERVRQVTTRAMKRLIPAIHNREDRIEAAHKIYRSDNMK